MANQLRADRHADQETRKNLRDERHALHRIEARVRICDRRHARFREANQPECRAELLLGEPLVAERDRERRTRDGRHRIEHAEPPAEREAGRTFGLDRPPEAGRLQEDQRQQRHVRDQLQPVGVDHRHQHRPDDDAGRKRDDDRAVDPQHVGIQHDLDRHERRVQHAVGEEEQRNRHGERGEPVPQRAVDGGGEERDADESNRVRIHRANLLIPDP